MMAKPTLTERWKAFWFRLLDRLMEAYGDDPSVTVDDWKEKLKKYKEVTGQDYVRKPR